MEKSRNNLIASAHSKAKTILVSRHRKEFKDILSGVYRDMGLTVRPRLSANDKREAAMSEFKGEKHDA